MNTFIDTHSHIDMEEFKDNLPEVMEKCKQAGVEKVIIPGVNVEDTQRIIDLIEKFDNLYALVGLHPEEVSKWKDTDIDYFREVSKHEKVVGIGEIGLDYYWDKGNIDLQQEVLIKQIELAKELKLPIVIHDRDAHQDTLRILKETQANEVGVVLHCFSGSKEFLQECLNEGYYISLGGVTTFKNAIKPKEIAKIVPLERLFLETDAPYMTPFPHRGTTNYPYYIPIIAQQIAELKGITIEEVAKITTENATKFFNL